MFSLHQVSISLFIVVVNYNPISATSVDGEHAFSIRHTTIRHNQHAMSVNTFQEKIALGQWFGQPFTIPPVKELAAKLKSDSFVNKEKASSGSSSAPIEIDN